VKARRTLSNEVGVKKVKLCTSFFIMEKSLQIVAAKSATIEVDESLSPHVSQEEEKPAAHYPTTHVNRGKASVNTQRPVIF
jgi:hypothetical protein